MIRRTNKFSVGIWMITPSVMTSLLARDCPHSCLSNGEYSVASGAVMSVVWQVSRLTIGDRLQNVHQAGMIPRTGLYNLWCVKWNFLMCAECRPICQTITYNTGVTVLWFNWQVYIFNEAIMQENIRPSLVGLFADVAATQDNIVRVIVVFFDFV